MVDGLGEKNVSRCSGHDAVQGRGLGAPSPAPHPHRCPAGAAFALVDPLDELLDNRGHGGGGDAGNVPRSTMALLHCVAMCDRGWLASMWGWTRRRWRTASRTPGDGIRTERDGIRTEGTHGGRRLKQCRSTSGMLCSAVPRWRSSSRNYSGPHPFRQVHSLPHRPSQAVPSTGRLAGNENTATALLISSRGGSTIFAHKRLSSRSLGEGGCPGCPRVLPNSWP